MSTKYEIETVDVTRPHFKKEDLLQAMMYRYATKKFDPDKKIPAEDFQAILDAARLSPTSFGFEPFKLLVIQNKNLREKMRPFGWGIQAGLDASHFIVILARKKADLVYGSAYLEHIQHDVKELPEAAYMLYKDAYTNFAVNDFKNFESERAAFDWSCKQAYIVLGNMLTMAAYAGIDSCPLEGFQPAEMNKLLGEEEKLFDLGHYGVAVMAAFGYRDEKPHRNKTRRTLGEIVTVVE